MAVKHFFRRVFGIYPGEGKRTWHFAALCVLWGFASSVAETLSTGSFLEKLGSDGLALSYTTTALGMLFTAGLFLYFLRSIPASKILSYVIKIAAVFYTISAICMNYSPGGYFWFILLIFTNIFVAFLIASYWSFVDQYHDLQEAKRIYGLYNSCYFLGVVFAGFLISTTASLLNIFILYLLIPCILAVCICQIRHIVKTINPMEDDSIDEALARNNRKISSIIFAFRKSPFTIFLVLGSLIIKLLITTTEFSYREVLAKTFSPAMGAITSTTNENIIAEFLGKCKSFIGIGNILFGMFLFPKCIRRIGVANLILLPPLFFIGTFSGWVFNDTLWLAILGIIAVEGVLYTIEDSNFNILITVASAKLKGILRIINDSFFEPVGMLFSSFFLLFLEGYSRWFGLGLSVLFLVLMLVLRKFFNRALAKDLQQNAIHFERNISDWIHNVAKKERKEIFLDLQQALKNKTENERLLIYKYILRSDNERFFHLLMKHVDTFNEVHKIEILNYLDTSYFATHKDTITLVKKWAQQKKSQDSLVKWSSLYLVKKEIYPAYHLELLLQDDNEDNALLALHMLGEKQRPKSFEKLLDCLSSDEPLQKKQLAAQSLAKLSSYQYACFGYDLIEQLRQNSDSSVRLYLLEALGKMEEENFIKEIILSSLFFRPNEKRYCVMIIEKLQDQAIDPLISLIKDNKVHDRCRLLASKILGKIAPQLLKSLINDILPTEIERAYFYYFYGHTIQKRYPEYNLSLLQTTLLSFYESVIHFILHFVGAAGSIEDCDLIIHALHSHNAKAHANAIEMIENVCDKKIFKQIFPLIDDLPQSAKLQAYFDFHKKKSCLSLMDVLTHLELSSFHFDKTIGALMKAKLQLPNWQESVKQYRKISQGAFYQFANQLLQS